MIPDNHDPAAEQAVLAACLQSRLARDAARKVITGADFWLPTHEAIWDAMGRLDRATKEVTPVSVVSTLGGNAHAVARMPDLVTDPAMPSQVTTHAEIVRSWATRRRLTTAAQHVLQVAASPSVNPVGFAATVASQFAAIRDSGLPDSTSAETLAELLAEPDDEPDWVIPGLLERRDRFILTGQEGLGKSVVLRQIGIMAAAGLHPFGGHRVKPATVTIIDAENSRSQIRRKVRPLIAAIDRLGGQDPSDRVVIDCIRRTDITTDKVLAEIHHLLDATQPDIVIIGPLYRLVPRGINNDDDATPLLAALDTIRDRDHSPALLMEAHAGHSMGSSGRRDMRPRGSSALLGWPEFGFGLRYVEDGATSYADLVPWRGQRDERDWPDRLRKAASSPHQLDCRWLPLDAPDLDRWRTA